MFNFIRQYFRQVFLGLIALALCLFFIAHTVTGDRGLLSMVRLKREMADAKAELDASRAGRARLAHRVRILSLASLDLDMLDESSRRILGYAKPNNLVVFQ